MANNRQNDSRRVSDAGSVSSRPLSRRAVVFSSVAALALASGAALWPDQQKPVELGSTFVRHRWRDVFDVQVSDPKLQRHVEGFLNVLERGVFVHPDSGRWTSGQQIIEKISQALRVYEVSGFIEAYKINRAMPNGRFIISDYDGLYQHAPEPARLIFGGKVKRAGGTYPVGFSLGVDSLRGAQYYDAQGNLHPVRVDDVVIGAIAQLLHETGHDQMLPDIVPTVVSNMGGVPRDPMNPDVQFKRGSNGGYRTRYDQVKFKMPQKLLAHNNS